MTAGDPIDGDVSLAADEGNSVAEYLDKYLPTSL